MRILGIDSGFEKTGYALLDFGKDGTCKDIFSGVIYTAKQKSLSERILHFASQMQNILRSMEPDKIFCEQVFFLNNKKTAIQVAQFQGVLIFLSEKNSIPLSFIPPAKVKKTITGNGRSDKKAVEKMLYLELPLAKRRREDDETDAVAVAYAGFILSKSKL